MQRKLYLAIVLLFLGSPSIAVAKELTINQLSDVKTTDWAFVALQSLTERYGCIKGDRDRTYRGNLPLTRYEFAAGIQSCIDKLDEIIGAGLIDKISTEDLSTLKRLQNEFSTELKGVVTSIDSLCMSLLMLNQPPHRCFWSLWL
jgi:porin